MAARNIRENPSSSHLTHLFAVPASARCRILTAKATMTVMDPPLTGPPECDAGSRFRSPREEPLTDAAL
jgi:hypothetical protein